MIATGNLDLVDASVGDLQVSAICLGDTTLWENWVRKTGKLAVMKSSNTPAPFTTTYKDVFDDRTDTSWYTLNPLETGWANMKLYFHQPIKIIKLETIMGTGGPDEALRPQDDPYPYVLGIKADGSKIPLVENRSSTWDKPVVTKHTVPEKYQDVEFVGISIERLHGWQGWYHIWDCQITEWVQKGNNIVKPQLLKSELVQNKNVKTLKSVKNEEKKVSVIKL